MPKIQHSVRLELPATVQQIFDAFPETAMANQPIIIVMGTVGGQMNEHREPVALEVRWES